MRKVVLLAAAMTVATVVAGPVGAASSASKVSVRLFEFKVVPKPAKTKRGVVTFAVRNTGSAPHELVVLRTKLPPAKLPVKSGKAVESGRVGRVGPLRPGQSKSLRLALTAGKYVLLCNVPGHYLAGQRIGFTAT